MWDSMRVRRTRPVDLGASPRAKKARMEQEPHLLAEDEQAVLKVQRKAQLVKYFANGDKDSDLDVDPNSDYLDSDEGSDSEL